uniref:Uncharacterized protein n=1 Tax=Xiphophorus couchianus TaxID=32473 RepID=A0A3B5MMT0_9TELE
MGSRLSRQSSLDDENFSKKRRRLQDGAGEGGRGGGDFLFALMLKSDKLPGMLRRANHSPYMRRVAWIKEIQKLLRERRIEQATDVLKLLRKDLGLEGASLNDILYKNAAFLNLVDPISHELLLSLAREMQCPKKDADTIKSSDKICRQLIYHLTPHSKWLRKSMSRHPVSGADISSNLSPSAHANLSYSTKCRFSLQSDSQSLETDLELHLSEGKMIQMAQMEQQKFRSNPCVRMTQTNLGCFVTKGCHTFHNYDLLKHNYPLFCVVSLEALLKLELPSLISDLASALGRCSNQAI